VNLRQLLHRFLGVLETAVDDVNTERRRIDDMLLHEATETGQIRRDAGNSHHRTFRYNETNRN